MFRESQLGIAWKKNNVKKSSKRIRGQKVRVLYVRYGFYLHLVGAISGKLDAEQKNCVVISTRLSSMFFPWLLSLDIKDIEGEEMTIIENRVEKKFWPERPPVAWDCEGVDLSRNTPPQETKFSWDTQQKQQGS